MLSNEEKIYLIDLKIGFWDKRLEESIRAKPILNNFGNQGKIEENLIDIDNYVRIIEALSQEKSTLTNQG
jgi:hypothetical protein